MIKTVKVAPASVEKPIPVIIVQKEPVLPTFPLDVATIDSFHVAVTDTHTIAQQLAPELLPYLADARNAASNLKSALHAREARNTHSRDLARHEASKKG